jgi:hypothetical protein
MNLDESINTFFNNTPGLSPDFDLPLTILGSAQPDLAAPILAPSLQTMDNEIVIALEISASVWIQWTNNGQPSGAPVTVATQTDIAALQSQLSAQMVSQQSSTNAAFAAQSAQMASQQSSMNAAFAAQAITISTAIAAAQASAASVLASVSTSVAAMEASVAAQSLSLSSAIAAQAVQVSSAAAAQSLSLSTAIAALTSSTSSALTSINTTLTQTEQSYVATLSSSIASVSSTCAAGLSAAQQQIAATSASAASSLSAEASLVNSQLASLNASTLSALTLQANQAICALNGTLFVQSTGLCTLPTEPICSNVLQPGSNGINPFVALTSCPLVGYNAQCRPTCASGYAGQGGVYTCNAAGQWIATTATNCSGLPSVIHNYDQ